MSSFTRQNCLAVSLCFTVFLGGCQSFTHKQSLETFNTQYEAGDYQTAAKSAINAGKIQPDGTSSDLLWSLQAGSALTANGQFEYSRQVLDSAETLVKDEDTESVVRKVGERATATLLNDNFNRYDPRTHDSVMVNTYKALNSLFLKDLKKARVEFNRAADRQRRAAEEFKENIAKERKQLKEDDKKQAQALKGLDLKEQRKVAKKTIYDAFPELKEWRAYPDYVNPYTDYLHGLYFTLTSTDRGDLGKARHSLRRVAGMAPKNKAVRTDLKVATKLRNGAWRKSKLSPTVWVIFENGAAPRIDELLIPIPLFVVNSKVEYSQIALPKLVERERAYPYLEVRSGSKKLGRTEHLASIDRVVQTEFKKEFPLHVTQALASTLTKALIQYKAAEQGGLVGSLAAGVYQAMTTRADVRNWSALPKEVQVARIRKPKNNSLKLTAPALTTPLEITLPDTRFTVVYVRASAPGSQPVYQVAGFDA